MLKLVVDVIITLLSSRTLWKWYQKVVRFFYVELTHEDNLLLIQR